MRLKRVKGTRWLTGNTGFTLTRIARSSRPIVKVNCLTKLVDSSSPHCLLNVFSYSDSLIKLTKIISRRSVSAKKGNYRQERFLFTNSNRTTNSEKKISQWHELFFPLYKIVLMANGNRLKQLSRSRHRKEQWFTFFITGIYLANGCHPSTIRKCVGWK